MTTNKPEVRRYDCTSEGFPNCHGCFTMKERLRGDYVEWEDYKSLQDELEMYKSAFNGWLEKTEWVQEAVAPNELGMHRADVMKSRIEALQDECEKLRTKTSVTLGVGDGGGKLFVHGDYDSIKRVQALIFECEQLRNLKEEAKSGVSSGGYQPVYSNYDVSLPPAKR